MKELKKVFAKKFWIHVAFFVAAVAVILYFVPGRACRFKDVMIDTAGAFTGIVCSMIAIAVVSFAVKKLTAKRKDT